MSDADERINQDVERAFKSPNSDAVVELIMQHGIYGGDDQRAFIKAGKFEEAMASVNTSIAEVERYLAKSPSSKSLLEFTLARAYENKGWCIVMQAEKTRDSNMARQGAQWIKKALATAIYPRSLDMNLRDFLAKWGESPSTTNNQNGTGEGQKIAQKRTSKDFIWKGKKRCSGHGQGCHNEKGGMDLFETFRPFLNKDVINAMPAEMLRSITSLPMATICEHCGAMFCSACTQQNPTKRRCLQCGHEPMVWIMFEDVKELYGKTPPSTTSINETKAESTTKTFSKVTAICPRCGQTSLLDVQGDCSGACTYDMNLFQSGGGLVCVKCGIGYHAKPEGKGRGVLRCTHQSILGGNVESGFNFSPVCRTPIPATPEFITPKEPVCFIATAAYGSELSPEVNLLRQFREEHLRPYRIGRLFILVYETFSPPVANWIAERNWARIYIRRWLLSPIIAAIFTYKEKREDR